MHGNTMYEAGRHVGKCFSDSICFCALLDRVWDRLRSNCRAGSLQSFLFWQVAKSIVVPCVEGSRERWKKRRCNSSLRLNWMSSTRYVCLEKVHMVEYPWSRLSDLQQLEMCGKPCKGCRIARETVGFLGLQDPMRGGQRYALKTLSKGYIVAQVRCLAFYRKHSNNLIYFVTFRGRHHRILNIVNG